MFTGSIPHPFFRLILSFYNKEELRMRTQQGTEKHDPQLTIWFIRMHCACVVT